MKPTNTTKALTTLFPLLFTATGFTSECNDIAPLADPENVENGYYNLDGHAINEHDRARLEKLAGVLRGQWHGIELAKSCVGHFTAPTEDRHRYKVRAEITRHDTGAIRIEAEKERQSDNTLKLDTLFISPEIDAEYGRLQGWHTLDFIDDNTVIFSQKSRVANGSIYGHTYNWPTIYHPASNAVDFAPRASNVVGNNRLIHIVKKIALRNNKLTVDRKLYVNGYFVEQNGWILER